MRKINFAVLAALMGLAVISCEKEDGKVITDNDPYIKNDTIKTLNFILDANGKLSKNESYFIGTDTTKVAGYYYAQDIELDSFVVSHSFSSWGFGEGFTYSNCSDVTTPGYTNLSAITGKGVKGNTYFIANAGGYDTPAQISFKNGKAYYAVECYVTNSTYAYLSMKDGDDFAKKFEQGDWFKLTITGFNGKTETGKVEFKLADGADIINTWRLVDLSQLGKVTSIKFTLSSTDNGDWGMNTPAYFCLDQLKVSE